MSNAWRKLRQTLCWLLNGRNEMECLFTVLDSEQDKSICNECRHHMWREL